jgi:hypothetical protein
MTVMKDLYIFGEVVYFSIIQKNNEMYFKGSREDLARLQFDKSKDLNVKFKFNTLENIRKLSRSDYYNSVKRGIKTYCSFEKIQRTVKKNEESN